MADSIETLGSYQIFPFVLDWSSGLKMSVTSAFTKTEFDGTVPRITEYTTRKPVTLVETIHLFDKEEESNFLQFFDDHKGRTKKFWVYARTNDFNLIEDINIGETQFDFTYNGYSDIHVSYDRVYIITKSGDIYTRRVDDAVADLVNDEMTLYLDPSIDVAIPLSDVIEFGRVLLVRFDLDTVQLKYHQTGVATVNLRFLEIPTEYPAT